MTDLACFAKARLFQDLTPGELEAVAAVAVRRSLAGGQTLLRMGDTNDSLFLVASGHLKVERIGVETNLVLATLGPGQILGEMSFLDRSRATGTVRSLEASELFEIPRAAFDDLLGRVPALGSRLWRNLALHLRDRLADANRVIDHYADVEQLLRDHPDYRNTYGGV